ncbi:MAG TPA: transglutaminaseTgpA domain-containing protein [Bryobacteraceae bacterium]|jgi:transglutaminase-like putative cysteine protease|nr:transglutaminaseTgpA domain-containing protein [Bryobacteraceae bacterium]
MSRSPANAAAAVERFFQFALWGLVVSGYLAVAGSGYLDAPTVLLTGAGLLVRALLISGALRLTISPRLVLALTLAYVGFFPLDYFFLSRAFIQSTVHLVFFLAVIQILTSRTNRDYFFMATIAFLELLAAAILSSNSNFFLFLTLYLLFAMAAFTSSEIRRSMQRRLTVARSGSRCFHWRLAALTTVITMGILGLTTGLFFILPRTDAALRRLVSHRYYLPGFSNQVLLGEIGEIKSTSRPVMHVQFNLAPPPPNLKWRGATLSDFNGRAWFEPPTEPRWIAPVQKGEFQLATAEQRRRNGQAVSYRISLNGLDSDVLFFAGKPNTVIVWRKLPFILGREDGSYRLGQHPAEGFFYDVWGWLGDTGAADDFLGADERRHCLSLPQQLDPRIAALARDTVRGLDDDTHRAIALGRFLRSRYGYTLELPSRQVADPLAYFLFTRRKGHCEYFASAMTVMLRTLGIPARLVTGFQSGIFNPLTGLYVIRASDAHSWVEAWLPGRGWTTFDPTPPDPSPGANALLTRLALYADAVETFWQEWVVSYDLSHQATLADRMEQASRRVSLRWLDRIFDAGDNWTYARAWLAQTGRWWLLGLFSGALGAWSAPRLWRLWRMRLGLRRLRRGQVSIADATLLYQRMLKLLKRRGYQKPAWLTPREFACSLPPSEIQMLVLQFTSAYNALRFGGQADAGVRLSSLLQDLEGGL